MSILAYKWKTKPCLPAQKLWAHHPECLSNILVLFLTVGHERFDHSSKLDQPAAANSFWFLCYDFWERKQIKNSNFILNHVAWFALVSTTWKWANFSPLFRFVDEILWLEDVNVVRWFNFVWLIFKNIKNVNEKYFKRQSNKIRQNKNFNNKALGGVYNLQ